MIPKGNGENPVKSAKFKLEYSTKLHFISDISNLTDFLVVKITNVQVQMKAFGEHKKPRIRSTSRSMIHDPAQLFGAWLIVNL